MPLKSWYRLRKRTANISMLAGAFTVVAGLAVLAGWATGFAPLTSLGAGLATTSPNCAVAFVLCGVSLWLYAGARRPFVVLARLMAAGAAGIGLVTLGEYLFRANFHIDAILFTRAVLAEGGFHPGRMAPGAALAVALAGIALVSLPRRAADWSAIALASLSLTVLTGYAYSLGIIGHLISYGKFPLPSAIAFLALAVGTLFADADRGLIRELYGHGPSGTVLRRLIPAAVIIPTLLAWIAQEGVRVRLLEGPVGFGAVAAATMVAFAAVIWVTARSLDASEARRAEVEGELIESESNFRELFDEREALQKQFAQSQKMEAVGRLAGGVAHDFNNMLTVIRSYCDLVVLETPESSPIRGDLREISRAADQAAVLSRQLLAFSRKQVMVPQVIDPNVVATEVHSMLRRVLPSAVRCELKLARDVATIRADPGSVNQVLMNLGINASDAMPSGGRLVIETSNCRIGDAFVGAHPGAKPGSYVCMEVSDTGSGMDPDTLAHMFEPFFTTKPVGKGTGLGLATVYGIVEQHHGHVDVQSEPGKGTRFKVYFPRALAVADAVPERVSGAIAHLAGAARVVLVVEDDDSVRTSIERILSREGYTVLSAGDGGEGMRLGKEHSGAIDLVISDVMMPEMGGRQFVERLAKLHPESRVLLISGYTDDDVLRMGQIDPSFAFLAKPFSVDELVQKVGGVLETV